MEEVHSYAPVQSDPLNSEKIVHIDIGTAHSVAVTGKMFTHHTQMKSHVVAEKVFFKFFQGNFLCHFHSGGILFPEKGQCFTFGSNQHGQIGSSSRRSSRVPYHVSGLQGIAMAACGDAFTLAIGAGE